MTPKMDLKSMIEIEHPDWLPTAFKGMKDTIRLIESGVLPDVLRGRLLVGNCMHILRCVYGSDLASAVAIRERVIDDVALWQKIDTMSPSEFKAWVAELEAGGTQ